MSATDCFRLSIVAEDINLHTAFVMDFSYEDRSGGSVHLDTGIMAGNFQTMVQGKWQAITRSTVNLKRYRAACVAGPHIGEIGFVEPFDINGALSEIGTDCPDQTAISFKRNTGYASRKDRGRVFFGPVNKTLS